MFIRRSYNIFLYVIPGCKKRLQNFPEAFFLIIKLHYRPALFNATLLAKLAAVNAPAVLVKRAVTYLVL